MINGAAASRDLKEQNLPINPIIERAADPPASSQAMEAHSAGRLDDLYSRALSLAGTGVWECDLRDNALTWSPAVFDLFGIPHGSRLDRRDVVAMYEDESREEMERLRMDAIMHQRGFSLDARIVRADGRKGWMRLTAGVVSSAGKTSRLYGVKQDITAERERWDALRRMAERDALTGLANRALFQSRFLDAPRDAPTITPLGALVLFDIDGFKQVNDLYGHAAGDVCLMTVAERLQSGFPDALLITRIGGDEFAVLIDVDRSPGALERAVERQLAMLAMPIFWQGRLLDIGASAGIAIADNPLHYDAEALFVAADTALYAAKGAGRNTSRIADPAAAVTGFRKMIDPAVIVSGAIPFRRKR